jgi:sulfur-oxidizing protein SoxX
MKRALISTFAAVTAAMAVPALANPIPPQEVPWEDEFAIPVSLSGTPGDVENGKVLMNKGAGNCIACHQVTDLADLPFHGEIGPTLDGVAARWSEAELRGILADAKRVFPGSMMPSFYKVDGFIRVGEAYTGKPKEGEVTPLLTAQQIEDLVAYLTTLKYQ